MFQTLATSSPIAASALFARGSRKRVLFKCRYMIMLRRAIIEKLGLHRMDTSTWHLHETVNEWWDKRTDSSNPNWHAMASLTMLVS